jgi:hypothetical protein
MLDKPGLTQNRIESFILLRKVRKTGANFLPTNGLTILELY